MWGNRYIKRKLKNIHPSVYSVGETVLVRFPFTRTSRVGAKGRFVTRGEFWREIFAFVSIRQSVRIRSQGKSTQLGFQSKTSLVLRLKRSNRGRIAQGTRWKKKTAKKQGICVPSHSSDCRFHCGRKTILKSSEIRDMRSHLIRKLMIIFSSQHFPITFC